MAIVSKIFFMAVAHILYYLGLFDIVDNGQRYGLYLGFYLIISLLFMMSRRLLPFFITKSLGLKEGPRNSKIVDLLSLLLFVVFMVSEVFFSSPISNTVAGMLFVVHATRAYWWYNKGIWKKSLLWSIYVAYCFLALGFGLKFLSAYVWMMPYLDIHAFAFGLGLMSLSFMTRVSLGHTGRNINEPPKVLNGVFILLVISFVFRVIMPMLSVENYVDWIFIAQILWSLSFLIFVVTYAPILLKKRIDGRFG